MDELKKLAANIKLVQDPEQPSSQVCMAHYPLDGDEDTLYSPQDSNSDKMKAASTSLYKRLSRKGLLKDFDKEHSSWSYGYTLEAGRGEGPARDPLHLWHQLPDETFIHQPCNQASNQF